MLFWQRMAPPHNGRSITCDLCGAGPSLAKDFFSICQTNQKFTKRTHGLLPASEIYKTNPSGAVLGHQSKIQNEPKNCWLETPLENTKNEPKTSRERLEARLDICTILIRAVATGGIRGHDVMGNIGEIPRLTGVTGRA